MEVEVSDQIRWVLNAGGTPSIQQGKLGARPPAGVEGRLFLDVDALVFYRDTGTAWVPIITAIAP
jgi:hypothetical protein